MRAGSTKRPRPDFLLSLDHSSSLTLQNQIRRQIIAAISSGAFPPGWRLPSSRGLARELGVARNTAMLAYQDLIAEGHLRSSERSGVFVNDMISHSPLSTSRVVERIEGGEEDSSIAHKVARRFTLPEAFRCPPDWQRYRYPFIDGRFDRSLFPVTEWREASRLALGASEVAQWADDAREADDEKLIEQIQALILPRRGVFAGRDEILILGSERQALHLISELLMDATSVVAVENPGLAQTRALLERRGVQLKLQPVDDEGLVIDSHLDDCDFVHVTPSRQRPTGVTMSTARRASLLDEAKRRNFLIIEDDFDHETTFLARPLAAMRGMRGGERVIYVAGLSRALAPGVHLSFLCAAPSLIAAARRLRDLTTDCPSPNNQRAAAHFIALGHYDSMNARLVRVVQERLLALREALNHYLPQSIAQALPQSVEIAPVGGGSSVWVRGPDGLDARRLALELEGRSVLIESASDYYGGKDKPLNMFRLGVTSIPCERIRAGVETIAKVIREMTDGVGRHAPRQRLKGARIAQVLSGSTILYRTVYGEPCTIEILPNGELRGRAGFAHEDVDAGRWRIEGDRWYRQWKIWAYGEEVGFFVGMNGDQLFWLNDAGQPVDSGVLVLRGEPAN